MSAAWNRFWHDFHVSPIRLRVLRFGLFGLLAFDLWLKMLEHAPRYGAGGFNVAQFRFLDVVLPIPTAEIVGVAWLLAGFAALRAAFGVAVRQSAVITGVVYAGVYLWSQADNYQHHFLVSLMLVTACFVPWEEASRPPAETRAEVRHWSVRMLYVQVALLYAWAAFAKIDPLWLDGSTMAHFSGGADARATVAAIAGALGTTSSTVHVLMAWSVMLGELFAAVVLLVPRLWWMGLLIVPWFHISVEWMDFKIEWFSYYMILINLVLFFPRRGFAWLGERFAGLRAWTPAWLDAIDLSGTPAMLLAVVTAAGCAFLALGVPVEGAMDLAVVVGLAAVVAQLVADPGVPLRSTYNAGIQVAAALAMVVSVTATDVAYDYYRQWGGDLKRRGETTLAIDRYEKANARKDGPARFFQLGKLYAQASRPDDALKAFEESLRRQRAALDDEAVQAQSEPTNAELHFEVGDRQLRIAERCKRLASEYRARGRGDAAGTHRRCITSAASAAQDAFARGLKHAPRASRGHGGKRRAAAYQ